MLCYIIRTQGELKAETTERMGAEFIISLSLKDTFKM
jgi:hypothetical protein